ncbi:MAG: Y-family DNA polymerase [Candidatus Micrarchaeia archaeon]
MSLILFIDMDSFYASCEIIRNKNLKDKEFLIGTASEDKKTNGVIESCSYPARKFGIKSGMPTAQALKIKPDIIYIAADNDYYELISNRIFNLLKSYCLIHNFKIEIFSIDEAAIDLNNSTYDEAYKLAEEIKKEIKLKMHMPSTIGIADGVILAKMVCDNAKPDGLKIIKKNEIIDFLNGKKIITIPGIGVKTEKKLNDIGIYTIDDLAKADLNKLKKSIGSFAEDLHLLANGIDKSKIKENQEIKSISREITLTNKSKNENELKITLDKLIDEIISTASKQNLQFKNISVKVKYINLKYKIKSRQINYYTNSKEITQNIAHSLLEKLINSSLEIKKVGIRISKFRKENKKMQQKIL